MREMRATRGVGSGARTDVGRPALAGVLVEECDGWRGGIHGGCVSRVLWVSRRVTRSDTRGERYFPDTNDISGCPFVFSELPLWDQPRRDVPQRTTTTTSMCIVPTDTSDCTHVMHRDVGCGERRVRRHRSREGPDPRARGVDSHPAGKKRSSLNSIGTSNGATGGASGGRTHAPETPAAYLHGVENDRPPPRASTPPAPADRARSGAGANRASGATRRRRRTLP